MQIHFAKLADGFVCSRERSDAAPSQDSSIEVPNNIGVSWAGVRLVHFVDLAIRSGSVVAANSELFHRLANEVRKRLIVRLFNRAKRQKRGVRFHSSIIKPSGPSITGRFFNSVLLKTRQTSGGPWAWVLGGSISFFSGSDLSVGRMPRKYGT